MALSPLDSLVRIGQLKAEPRNVHEAARMLAMARTRLADARLSNVSLEGRFTSAYNAAHAAALAALRWQGYRSENRYTVFQWHGDEYNSHNTTRLDVAGMKALLLKLDFMQRIARGERVAEGAIEQARAICCCWPCAFVSAVKSSIFVY